MDHLPWDLEPRVPIGLRSLTSLLSATATTRKMAHSVYFWSARTAAEKLGKNRLVSRVELTGGFEGQWEPGISDLDLILHGPHSFLEARLDDLRSLRETYQTLRKKNPLLGECRFRSAAPRAFSPPDFDVGKYREPIAWLELFPELRKLEAVSAEVPHPLIRFCESFENFAWAHCYLAGTGKKRSRRFALISARRALLRSLRANALTVNHTPELPALFALAFKVIEQLGKEAQAALPKLLTDTIEMRVVFSPPQGYLQPLVDLWIRNWDLENAGLYSSPVEKIAVLDGPRQLTELEFLYRKILRRAVGNEPSPLGVPVLLHRQTLPLVLNGWGTFGLFSPALSLAPEHWAAWGIEKRSVTAFTRFRLAILLQSLPAKMIYASRESVAERLEQVWHGLFSVGEGVIAEDKRIFPQANFDAFGISGDTVDCRQMVSARRAYEMGNHLLTRCFPKTPNLL